MMYRRVAVAVAMVIRSVRLIISSRWGALCLEGICTRILKKYEPHQYTETYRNNQTISTKCQYQIAASYPKWWVVVKWCRMRRIRQIIKKEVPIIT